MEIVYSDLASKPHFRGPLLLGLPFFGMITNLRLILLHNWIKKEIMQESLGWAASSLCRNSIPERVVWCRVSRKVEMKWKKNVIRTDEPEATCHFLNP